jgi:membrane-bound ClpP family serine protease/DNA-binding CsgD family transcriptional regulator
VSLDLLLTALLDPNVVFLLLNLGLFGLAAELLNPGTLVSGAIGVVALLLALVALGSLPVNALALALLVLAFGLFYADAHLAGHGVLSAAGLAAYLLGGLLLFSPADAAPWQPGPVVVSPWLLGAIAAALAAYFFVVARAALRARRLPPSLRPNPRAGVAAVAVTPLAPRGVVRVRDEEWSAVAAEPVPAGEPVEVLAREGLHLRVRRPVATATAAAPPPAALPDPLTRREREIAALIARGLTNRQIAAELVIAETTADRHVSNILGKLAFATRAQVAVWASDRGLNGARTELHTQNAPL